MRWKLPSATLAAAVVVLGGTSSQPANLRRVLPNDNRLPAGTLQRGVLTLNLELRTGVWHPESPTGDSVVAPVFAEVGKPGMVPGPLIRVPAGTRIDATVTNALTDSSIAIHGLYARPAAGDSAIRLKPGESRRVQFDAGAPGTYLYRAVVGTPDTTGEQEQAAGALVVDSAGQKPTDRVFVINIWGQAIDSSHYSNALAINGRSWPYTERLAAGVGDSLQWRWVNASGRVHPMHLHGFYFRVDGSGSAMRDSAYTPDRRRLVVTESMAPLSTMQITWAPDRPGNWVFHCHIAFHVVSTARLKPPEEHDMDRMAHDPGRHMAGLVMGISVRAPRGWVAPSRPEPRALRLFIQEGTRRYRAPRSLGFVLQRDGTPPAADSIEIPGAPLILTQNEPADITVINHLREPAAIHWHGIELESFSDGIPGWSGIGKQLAPSIEPGDSFVAHLTLPRPGTFIYHTHMNDLEQLTAGLYGAIVVLPPGQRFDPARDHIFVAGWDGLGSADTPPRLLVNGDPSPPPLELAAGVTHRFRFVGIGAASGARFAIRKDTSLVTWRAVARDGADLPSSQAVMRPARRYVGVGETFDFEWIPEPGEYTLTADLFGPPLMTRKVVVR